MPYRTSLTPIAGRRLSTVWRFVFVSLFCFLVVLLWRSGILLLPWILLLLLSKPYLKVCLTCWRQLVTSESIGYFVFELYAGAFIVFGHIRSFFYLQHFRTYMLSVKVRSNSSIYWNNIVLKLFLPSVLFICLLLCRFFFPLYFLHV